MPKDSRALKLTVPMGFEAPLVGARPPLTPFTLPARARARVGQALRWARSSPSSVSRARRAARAERPRPRCRSLGGAGGGLSVPPLFARQNPRASQIISRLFLWGAEGELRCGIYSTPPDWQNLQALHPIKCSQK